MVPSPKVATYDLQPEMSAPELTDKAVEAIDSGKYDLIVLNFANPDMVGHTGSLPAAIKAVETVDTGLGRIADAIARAGRRAARHRRSRQLRDDARSRDRRSAHRRTPPIRCRSLLVGGGDATLAEGRLADLAPTLLELMELPQPKEMTGASLMRPTPASAAVACGELRERDRHSTDVDPAIGTVDSHVESLAHRRSQIRQPQHVRHRIKPGLLAARPQRRLAARRARRSCGPRPCGRARCARPGRRRSRCDRPPRCRRAATQSRCRRACARRSRRRGRAPSAARDRCRGLRRPRVPSISAVPDGASIFLLWCISKISMSKLVVERLRDALDQRREQIDAEAHIAGLHDHGALARLP